MKPRLVSCRYPILFNHCTNGNYWSFEWFSESPLIRCCPVCQEILDISKIAIEFHRISPPFFIQARLRQCSRRPFLYSAFRSFSNADRLAVSKSPIFLPEVLLRHFDFCKEPLSSLFLFGSRLRNFGLSGSEHKQYVSWMPLSQDVPNLSHEKCVRLLAPLYTLREVSQAISDCLFVVFVFLFVFCMWARSRWFPDASSSLRTPAGLEDALDESCGSDVQDELAPDLHDNTGTTIGTKAVWTFFLSSGAAGSSLLCCVEMKCVLWCVCCGVWLPFKEIRRGPLAAPAKNNNILDDFQRFRPLPCRS